MAGTNDDLERWRLAVDNALEACHTTGAFPGREAYTPHTDFLVSKGAETKGILRRKDLLQFLDHARAALLELRIQLKLASELGLLDSAEERKLTDVASEIGCLLDGLLNRFQEETPVETPLEMHSISDLG
jgi:hypothetical protein